MRSQRTGVARCRVVHRLAIPAERSGAIAPLKWQSKGVVHPLNQLGVRMLNGMKQSARAASDKLDAIDAEKVKEQASEVAAALSDGAHHAGEAAAVLAAQARDAALQAKDWGTPKVEAFVEWATPRLEQAWVETLKATAPRVEKAAQKASPVIDNAHDKLVDELLPRFVTAINEAAQSAADAAVKGSAIASEKTQAGATHLADSIAAASKKAPLKLTEAAQAGQKHAKRSHKGWWIVAGAAAAGGAYVLWRRSQIGRASCRERVF